MNVPPAETQPTERPALFSGREWLRILRTQYGEDLRGLTLAELEKLPDIEWAAVVETKKNIRRFPWLRKQVVIAQHPSEPGFSFDNFPEFFDGRTYVRCLTEQYGENLEDLPPAAIRNLPVLHPPYPAWYRDERSHLEDHSPAESIDLQRRGYAFLQRPAIHFPES